MKHVAFLRGINVGGNATVPMSELKKAFEELGYTNITTILNSGNVIFDSSAGGLETVHIAKKIEEKLHKTFGFPITVVIRAAKQIQKLIQSNPFKEVTTTAQTRLMVTFLTIKPWEVCKTIEVIPGNGTTDFMKLLEKEFGKKITTRNWNTILRIEKLLK